MWEVTSPAGDRGTLFGTIHALPDGVAWRTPALDRAFAESGMLVVEVAELGDPAGAALLADLAETPGQPPLSRRVEPHERPALVAMMQAADMDDGDFASTESWAAALMLNAATRSGDSANGVDRALIDEAGDDGGVVVGLESFAGQLALFDGLSQQAQGDLLAAVARDWQDGRGDAMLRAWLAGDAQRMEAHVGGELLANPELREVLLVRRNTAWTRRIAALVESGRRPLVAVGAAHLVGDAGVVALLEARGYTARRIQ